MTTDTDTNNPSSTAVTPQFYAYFGAPMVHDSNEQVAQPPPAYSTIEMPSIANNTTNMTPNINTSTALNELVNQQLAPSTTHRPITSQQILHVTQHINNKEKLIDDKLAATVWSSVIGVIIGIVCIIVYIIYRDDLCGDGDTFGSCAQIYSPLIVGCIALFWGIFRISTYVTAKTKISRIKRIWQQKVILLQQTSLNGY